MKGSKEYRSLFLGTVVALGLGWEGKAEPSLEVQRVLQVTVPTNQQLSGLAWKDRQLFLSTTDAFQSGVSIADDQFVTGGNQPVTPNYVTGLDFVGCDLWVADNFSNDLKVLDANFNVTATYPGTNIDGPNGLAFDGTYLWGGIGSFLEQYDPNSGTVMQTFSVPTPGQILGIAFVLDQMWILDERAGTTFLHRILVTNTVRILRSYDLRGLGIPLGQPGSGDADRVRALAAGHDALWLGALGGTLYQLGPVPVFTFSADFNAGIPSSFVSSCSASVCSSVAVGQGNPGGALNVGGTAENPGTSMTSLNGYRAYYAGGLNIELDAWLVDSGCHFTDVTFGLWRENPPVADQSNWVVFFWLNKGCVQNNINVGLMSPNPAHQEVSGFLPGAYVPNQWNRARICIRPDQRVEFYLDSNLVYRTANTIDPAFCGEAAFTILGKESGGEARVDNVSIEEYPLPGILGNVNEGSGLRADTLFVNGSVGAHREVVLAPGQPIEIRLSSPPRGPIQARYAFWAWLGKPSNPLNLDVGTSSLGTVVNPTPLHPFASPQPFRSVLGGLGPVFSAGTVELPGPGTAPFVIQKNQGLLQPITITIQALVEDTGAGSSDGFALSNAVVIRI